MTGRSVVRALGATGLGLLSMLPGAPKARADCVYALVYVGRQNDANVYAWGPDPCVTQTDWDHVVFVGPTDVGQDTYDGMPNRVYADVRIPVP